jgi:hypothetical protein
VANRAQRRAADKRAGRGGPKVNQAPTVSEEERILSLGGMKRRDLDALHAQAQERYGLGIGVIVQEEQRHQMLEDSLAEERRRANPWTMRWWQLRRAERRERVERQLWNTRLAECAAAVAATADQE